jgi:hypothetical protein
VRNPAEENVPSPGLNPTRISLREFAFCHHQTDAYFRVSETPTSPIDRQQTEQTGKETEIAFFQIAPVAFRCGTTPKFSSPVFRGAVSRNVPREQYEEHHQRVLTLVPLGEPRFRSCRSKVFRKKRNCLIHSPLDVPRREFGVGMN